MFNIPLIKRKIFEFLGNDRYSRPARFEMERQLEAYLPERGFFIEVGANDGYFESNTYYLEKFKNWRGICIEPIPELYQTCIKERKNSKVFNCALVSHDYPETSIKMVFAHTMSTVKGAIESSEEERIKKAKLFHGINPYEVQVMARTLTSILDELKVSEIDFFSLDVEGYELSVLKGLDFERYRPMYMLVECLNELQKEKVEEYISNLYTIIAQLSKRDYLYRSKLKT